MGILEEVLKNKEEILVTLLELLEGKETKASINLDGVEFHIGKSAVKAKGNVELTFVPFEKKKK